MSTLGRSVVPELGRLVRQHAARYVEGRTRTFHPHGVSHLYRVVDRSQSERMRDRDRIVAPWGRRARLARCRRTSA